MVLENPDTGTSTVPDTDAITPGSQSDGRAQQDYRINKPLHDTAFNYLKPGIASNVEIQTRSTSVTDALTGLSAFLSGILSIRLDANEASTMAMEALAHVTKLIDGEQKVGRWGWSFLEDIAQFAPHGLIQMRLKAVNDNSFDCVILKGDGTEGTTTVKVAKPPKFRKTDFHEKSVAGVAYDYGYAEGEAGNSLLREATDADDNVIEEQIIPLYAPGQTLYVMPVIGSPGLPDDAEFIEMNVDGRSWAQTDVL